MCFCVHHASVHASTQTKHKKQTGNLAQTDGSLNPSGLVTDGIKDTGQIDGWTNGQTNTPPTATLTGETYGLPVTETRDARREKMRGLSPDSETFALAPEGSSGTAKLFAVLHRTHWHKKKNYSSQNLACPRRPIQRKEWSKHSLCGPCCASRNLCNASVP